MGVNTSRESEVSGRIVEALEEGHLHTLALLFKFVQHCDGGAPATQIANKAGVLAAKQHAPDADTLATYKPRRIEAPASTGPLDAETAAFHARAAALARTQAEASGLQSASFPIPVDLNALRLHTGDTLLLAAVKRDQPQILKMVLDAGVDVDAQDAQGWTALHHAAHLQRIGCVTILLQAQAFTLIHSTAGLLPSQCTRHAELKARLEAREAAHESRLMAEVVDFSGGAYVGRATVFEESGSATFPLHLYSVRCAAEVLCSPPAAVETEVFFRGPVVRSASDCICLYYVDDPAQPHVIRPRMGSVFYLGERRSKAVCTPPPRHTAADTAAETNGAASPASAPVSAGPSSSSSPSGGASPLSASELGRLGWDSLVVSLNMASLPLGCYRFLYFDSARNACMAASDVFALRAGPPRPPLRAGAGSGAGPTVNTATPTAAAASSATAASSASAASAARPLSSTSAAASSSRSGGSIFSFLSPWSSPASASASVGAAPSPPVALHPSFSLLSATTPTALSAFLSSPPPYFRSHFRLNASAVQLALQLDPALAPFRARFVPAVMRDDEFWTRYFWQMSRLEQPEVDRDRYSAQAAAKGAAMPGGSSSGGSDQAGGNSARSTSTQAPSPNPNSEGGYVPPTPSPSTAPLAESSPAAAAAASSSPSAVAAGTTAPVPSPSTAYTPPAVSTPTSTAAAASPAPSPSAAPITAAPAAASAPVDQPASATPLISSTAAAAAAAPVSAVATASPAAAPSNVKGRAAYTPDDDDEESSYVPPSFAALPLHATSPPAQT